MKSGIRKQSQFNKIYDHPAMKKMQEKPPAEVKQIIEGYPMFTGKFKFDKDDKIIVDKDSANEFAKLIIGDYFRHLITDEPMER